MKNRYLIYIALLILTLSITLGVTYSYLAAKINNRESSSTIKVESGQLSITYENNSGNIILNNVIPGDSVTKQFTLTGINNTKPNAITTNTDLKYKIGIAIDNNTFSEGALTYALTKDSSSSSNGKLANDATGTINSSGIQYIGNGYFVSGANNDKHIYNLTISFPDTNEDQSIDQGASFACHVTVKDNYVPQPKSFAEDTWETIVANTSSNVYNVGDTKQVEIGGQRYTLRVANNTTPDECDTEGFSQTACGFVVEFADIVEKRQMNPSGEYKGQQYPYGWNVDGWPATEMRKYANGDFYNKLPVELRNVIIDTKVVSGHGNTIGETNFATTDKIYLLSAHEVWEDGTSDQVLKYDTAANNTRQLDYYKNLGVTTSNYLGAKKKYNSSNFAWWLRGATSSNSANFLGVHDYTSWCDLTADYALGFAPAFRIGDKENTVTPKSFAEDTWETIAAAVKNGQLDAYPVGSEKEVEIGGNNYTVRVANNTTPTECSKTDFSQTACGFVVEFVDIIEERTMNSSQTSVGGWPATEMRTYANGEFYNNLPAELRKVIIDTKVISGHNDDDSTNYTSTDKIYLLSAHEVWADKVIYDGGNERDAAYNQTRQLDYYANLKVTTNNYSGAIKKNINGSNSSWLLRGADSLSTDYFLAVTNYGSWAGYGGNLPAGFAPAFRIGDKENTVTPKSFAEDTWETIADNTSSDVYKVGDTKQVLIGNNSYTVRIANKSTPTECSGTDFSQTACGFVVEFADIVETRKMNSTATNVGGWPATEMRTYANEEFFNKLPAELRNVIIETKVVSGHGRTSGETNFTSTDKIYLLSPHEVWADKVIYDGTERDTAYNQTRQLDYYVKLGVTTTSSSGAIKKNNGSNSYWWLRGASSDFNSTFLPVRNTGTWNDSVASNSYGLAPAFRIG